MCVLLCCVVCFFFSSKYTCCVLYACKMYDFIKHFKYSHLTHLVWLVLNCLGVLLWMLLLILSCFFCTKFFNFILPHNIFPSFPCCFGLLCLALLQFIVYWYFLHTSNIEIHVFYMLSNSSYTQETRRTILFSYILSFIQFNSIQFIHPFS